MEADLLAGAPPFDNVSTVFVSHNHSDHFHAVAVLAYMRAQPEVRLVAPTQVIAYLSKLVNNSDANIMQRVTGVDINYGDDPVSLMVGSLKVAAFRIPHSGWPNHLAGIQNIAFSVTIDGVLTVLHLGDADTRDEHFSHNGDEWAALDIDAAFPPYWFLMSSRGVDILETRLKPNVTIGIHVPRELPPHHSARLKGQDYFQQSGETRQLAD